MKMIKRFAVVVLALLLALSACGCLHEKDEVAVTVGDIEFTSAYYMCAFVFADLQGQQEVYDSLSEKDKSNAELDYRSKKIDGKEYQKWVEDEAVKTIKNNAAYRTLCKNNKVSLSDKLKESLNQEIEQMWAYYSDWFKANGVYRETFETYKTDTYYKSAYFDYLYGKEGTKAPAAEEITAKMTENLILADVLEGAFTSYDQTTGAQKTLTDAEKTELKNKFNAYAADLTAGKKTFDQVYHEHKGTEQAKEDTEITDFGESDVAPKNRHASVFGTKAVEEKTGSSYQSAHFDTVKAMAVGEVKVIELEDNAGIMLVVKRDIIDDKYYADNFETVVRYLLKDADFEKEIAAHVKATKCEVSDYAVGQFEANDIPEMTYNEQ